MTIEMQQAAMDPSAVEALADLPVRVDVSGAWRDELVAWLEGDLRWQVVRAGGALRPQVRITDDPADRTATVVVVDGAAHTDQPDADTDADTDSDADSNPGADPGPTPVLRWPQERTRLPSMVLRAVRPRAAAVDGRGCRVLGIGGLAGGVGTSTVALAVGGLGAWRGARTLVAGGDDLLDLCGAAPWRGPGLSALAALSPVDAGREVMSLAHRIGGIGGLLVIGGVGRQTLPGRLPWPVDLLVLDLRGRWDLADVVVARAGQRRPSAALRGTLLVQDAAGVSRSEAAALLDRSPTGWLADDPRVRRAGVAGRAPAGLPGRWLRDLDRALGSGARVAA